jgi:DNA polymerase III sliding clamp (beta) subunit (PCNA family)
MQLNRQEVLKALQIVSPGLAAREIIEQSTSFVFAGGHLLTYNDEVAVRCPLPGSDDLNGAVKSKELYALVSKLKGETIDLEVEDGKIKIKGGKNSKAWISLDAEISLPLNELETPKKWLALPDNFAKAVSLCLFSAGNDMTMPMLTTVNCTAGEIQSSDRYRLTVAKLGKQKVPAFSTSVAIPAASARELVKHNPTEFCATDNWIHFKIDGQAIFSCRQMNGQFPDVSAFMAPDKKMTAVPFPDKIQDLIDRARVFSANVDKGEDELINVGLDDNWLMIAAESKTGGFEERVRVQYVGKVIQFQINPVFLSQILAKTSEGHYSAERGLIRFDTPDFTHILCLVK